MNEIIRHHMIDVEDELLQLDIAQWMAQVKVLIHFRFLEKESDFRCYKDENDIRCLF